jgi:ribosome hibernation promoting factor
MSMKTGKGKKSRAIERKTKRAERIKGAEVAVHVTFRHMEPTDALRQYAEKKFAHLGRVLKRPGEVHLVLEIDKYRQCGEAIFKSGKIAATAAEENTDLYAVIDLLTDKIVGQLKKHVEKVKGKKMRSPSTPEVLAAAEEN